MRTLGSTATVFRVPVAASGFLLRLPVRILASIRIIKASGSLVYFYDWRVQLKGGGATRGGF